MTVIGILHMDGIAVLCCALALAWAGQSYHRWLIRVPVFALACFDFCLGLSLLGLYRPDAHAVWPWFRLGGDLSFFALIAIYLALRRSHPLVRLK